MSKARLIITAVTIEHRSATEVARTYGVSRSWIYELLARYRTEGEAAFEPRSRAPRTQPTTTPPSTVELIVSLRNKLTSAGLDAGADTIRWHLQHHHQLTVSRATIYRAIRHHGLVEPEPKKRPKASYIRFAAEQPNETWQSDMTHYRLTGNRDVEIITWLDDHSRMALSVTAHKVVTGHTVTTTFLTTIEKHGVPASTLTDNGLIYTTRHAGGRGGRNSFETTLTRHGIVQKNSKPNHPTTCGKVERFQQTLKHWLNAQPRPATIPELQTLLDRFVDIYNHQRPHRSLPHHQTPAAAYNTRPKATPASIPANPPDQSRLRRDRVDNAGKITLRHNGHLYKIGIGRPHNGTPVLLLINQLEIRVVHATTGELLRQLTLDPTRTYQPTGHKQGGPKRPYGPHKNPRPKNK